MPLSKLEEATQAFESAGFRVATGLESQLLSSVSEMQPEDGCLKDGATNGHDRGITETSCKDSTGVDAYAQRSADFTQSMQSNIGSPIVR